MSYHPESTHFIRLIIGLFLVSIYFPLACFGQDNRSEFSMLKPIDFSVRQGFLNNYQQSKMDYPIGGFGLLINLLGVLQFGPIVQLEFRIGSSTLLGPHVRFAGFGLLTHLMNTYDETSLASMAVGFGFKQMIGPSSKPHKFYIGALTEFGWGSGTSEDYDYFTNRDVDAKYQHKYISVVANTGYRWRFASRMFLNLGAFVGLAIELEDKKTYPYEVTYDNVVMFLGMIDFSFGWEF